MPHRNMWEIDQDDEEYIFDHWMEVRSAYTTQNKDVSDLIEIGCTYAQARRYAMFTDGLSMSEIADVERITKASVQSSIDQARMRLSPNHYTPGGSSPGGLL